MYEYDDAGRLLRAVTTREAEWDDTEREWMLALADYRANLCPLCGRHLSICTDPVNEGRVKVGPPTRCHFTTAVEKAREPYRGKATQASALMFSGHLS